jgi:hypothetical protein
MTTRHHDNRRPKRNGGFSWGRFPMQTAGATSGVEWRLFRRDHTGALHFECRYFDIGEDRQRIASVVRAARHRLRDTVDEIDLQAMGVEA